MSLGATVELFLLFILRATPQRCVIARSGNAIRASFGAVAVVMPEKKGEPGLLDRRHLGRIL
jgi:hypothetical protein